MVNVVNAQRCPRSVVNSVGCGQKRPDGNAMKPVAEPPVFAVSDAGAAGGALIGEIAGNPLFTLAAGTLVEEGSWRLSTSMWDQLWDGLYYARLMDPENLETLGCWSFAKSSCADERVGNAL